MEKGQYLDEFLILGVDLPLKCQQVGPIWELPCDPTDEGAGGRKLELKKAAQVNQSSLKALYRSPALNQMKKELEIAAKLSLSAGAHRPKFIAGRKNSLKKEQSLFAIGQIRILES